MQAAMEIIRKRVKTAQRMSSTAGACWCKSGLRFSLMLLPQALRSKTGALSTQGVPTFGAKPCQAAGSTKLKLARQHFASKHFSTLYSSTCNGQCFKKHHLNHLDTAQKVKPWGAQFFNFLLPIGSHSP